MSREDLITQAVRKWWHCLNVGMLDYHARNVGTLKALKIQGLCSR